MKKFLQKKKDLQTQKGLCYKSNFRLTQNQKNVKFRKKIKLRKWVKQLLLEIVVIAAILIIMTLFLKYLTVFDEKASQCDQTKGYKCNHYEIQNFERGK